MARRGRAEAQNVMVAVAATVVAIVAVAAAAVTESVAARVAGLVLLLPLVEAGSWAEEAGGRV